MDIASPSFLARSSRAPAILKRSARWRIPLLIGAIILAYRAISFGDPVLDYDEQLYLTVGDRMLHGQLPYVHMWDRKPVGLFLFYAGIRALGGTGIVEYQMVAALCVVATALLIRSMALRHVGEGARRSRRCPICCSSPHWAAAAGRRPSSTTS